MEFLDYTSHMYYITFRQSCISLFCSTLSQSSHFQSETVLLLPGVLWSAMVRDLEFDYDPPLVPYQLHTSS